MQSNGATEFPSASPHFSLVGSGTAPGGRTKHAGHKHYPGRLDNGKVLTISAAPTAQNSLTASVYQKNSSRRTLEPLATDGKYEFAASLLESSNSRFKHSESVAKAERFVYLNFLASSVRRSPALHLIVVGVRTMTQSRLIGIASVLLAAALSVPAWGADSAQPGKANANPARPGSLNYVEGQVSIGGQNLGPEAIGRTELNPGQSLETQAGKTELLLTPGVFFRLGDNSSATMISPTLTDTELRLDKGEATVEVAELHPENNVVIAEDGAKVQLTKTGFYDFDADHYIVRVYQGEANVEVNGQDIKLEDERQLAFNAGASMKPEKFDKEQVQDDLYRWSSLRSSYLAEANVDRAQDYQVGSYGAGWDWDPNYGAYTFIPGDGIFYSPFGWGFYSPFNVGFAPILFFGHFDHDFDRDFRHFGDRDHDRDHFADRGHGDRDHGDRGHFGDGEHHEAHYYDQFDHGAYHGPGHSDHSGFAGGVVASGSHVGSHGGGGSIGSHGMGGVQGGGGAQGGGAGHVARGVQGGGAGHVGGGVQGGGGFHSGGSGHAGGGGSGGHH